jgi:hypothetical protein
MAIQSVIFDKKHFTISKALNYLKRYGLKNIKPPHITDNYIRMRIEQPIYKNYITKEASDSGVKYIVGF